MFTDQIDADAASPADVRAQYEATLETVLDDVGVDAAAAETGIDADRLDAIRAGESAGITVTEAAEILALTDDWPDAETLKLEVQDHVMLEMSSAIVDVESLAAAIDDDLDAKEVQQRVEGRHPMTIGEYARITHHLAAENPW
ncbi:DUF5791 family protein [Halocalculus aciditolerans]|uniref:Uncharacterized protein n=1 Tax=Halocalculus aciditolerans TaxID=1383812 RepID=A0A830FQX3_9EURY|nr:DUF5791 family protein [Halocalculus aciditolerans]GGL72533.1 hypothetical protein GCM10009039_33130 [Halocalculus aciditolerans]